MDVHLNFRNLHSIFLNNCPTETSSNGPPNSDAIKSSTNSRTFIRCSNGMGDVLSKMINDIFDKREWDWISKGQIVLCLPFNSNMTASKRLRSWPFNKRPNDRLLGFGGPVSDAVLDVAVDDNDGDIVNLVNGNLAGGLVKRLFKRSNSQSDAGNEA